ncbi:MAG: hypothetical protein AAFQ07_05005 [Chloroflexota bacterium]
MAKRPSIFGDEWRRCLEEHYKYVVRRQDMETEETLRPHMYTAGFRDDDLKQLEITATMRADDMPDDYVPDMLAETQEDIGIIEEMPTVNETTPDTTFVTHPAECQCAACMDAVLEDGHDEEGQPLDEDAKREQAEREAHAQAKEDTPDTPKQRSLF